MKAQHIFLLALLLSACQPAQPILENRQATLPATIPSIPSQTPPPTAQPTEQTPPSLPPVSPGFTPTPGEFTLLKPAYLPPGFVEYHTEMTDLGGGIYYRIEGKAYLAIVQHPLPLHEITQKHLQTDYPPELETSNNLRIHGHHPVHIITDDASGTYVLWYQDADRVIEIVLSTAPNLPSAIDLMAIAISLE